MSIKVKIEQKEPIAAIVTALAEAAVSIIRISGNRSWEIVETLTQRKFTAGEFQLTWLYDGDKKVDRVLVLAFASPHSYTGEDVVEIHCHGGIYLTQKILELALNEGARLAKAGEFTERAFLNQKMDLSQAEAIIDLISARTEKSGDNAIGIYQGQLGQEIWIIRSALLELLGGVIAGIDFPDEVAEFDSTKFTIVIKKSLFQIETLLKGAREGHILRHGYKVAIIGNPNAGKSSLLNALLKNDRAIVTNIAGTTRDTIEESFNINGMPIVLVDTAGIRDSEDTVERIGIQRSKDALSQADLVVLLLDAAELEAKLSDSSFLANLSAECQSLMEQSKQLLLIANKSDLLLERSFLNTSNLKPDLFISAKDSTNLEQLKELIYQKILAESDASASNIKINDRQADLLRQSKESLIRSLEAAENELAQDFWTIDLKAGIDALGEVTGALVTEELLDNIFSRFCIGK